MSESENVQRVREGYAAARRGDLALIRELLDPDVRWHGGNPDDPAACRGREQALRVMSRAGGGRIPELVDVREAGERVVLIMRRLDDAGRPELVANLTTLRDGRVIEMVHHPQVDTALRAAGLPADPA